MIILWFAWALIALVNTEPDMKVVAEAHDGAQAVELFDKFNPDLVLMDMRMPIKDGIWATIEIVKGLRRRVF